MSRFINNFVYESNNNSQQKRPKTNIKNKSNKKEPKNFSKISSSVADDILKLKQKREDRNRKEDEKQHKKNIAKNQTLIQKTDEDYNFLIQKKKLQIEYQQPKPYKTSESSKIFVCVRKRPIFQKELMEGEIDCISAINPKVYIYDCKIKIDGYTKYIDVNEFNFDNAFNENDNTNLLYKCSIQPSLDILMRGGVVTCFAYGQTGSGKTYTMKGIQDIAIENIFQIFNNLGRRYRKKYTFYISFYELYLGLLYDLLNNRNKVMALEDKNQKVQIYGLTEQLVESAEEMKSIIDFANNVRTTHNTVTNETSSRSHAVCNFIIKIQDKDIEKEYAKLSLVDLAGSERATETQSNDKNRLAEGADINKSLLALKECIRALDARKTKGNNEHHVPFRNSKLTLVLRDSFLGDADLCKIIMISCISPSNRSANHTINTLRYSMRLKEKIPNVSNNNNIKNNAGGVKQIPNKKNNLININKSGKISKSPNIKRNINNNKEKFHVIENKVYNKYHYSNGNINYSSDLNKNNIGQKSNKIMFTKNNTNNAYINKKKSPNYKKKENKKYFDKKNTNISNNNNNSTNFQKKIPKTSKDIKKRENQYSSIVNKKKKELQRAQTSSNKLNKEKIYKENNYSKIDRNHKINKTVINPIKYYPSYQGNDNQKDNYKNNYVYISNAKNIDLNIDTDPGEGLIHDQMDVINSQQKYLTEDGKLINKFKGLTKDNLNKQIYTPVIENIIQSKMNYLNKLQDNIKEYKKLLYNYKK